MPARLLVIGLDAAPVESMERWAAAGQLPALAGFAAESSSCLLQGRSETAPFAIWNEISTGRSCARTGVASYFKLHSGEAQARPTRAADLDVGDYFWSAASRAGHRVAVVDVHQTFEVPNLEGLQLRDWGNHDQEGRAQSSPPNWLSEIEARFGSYPVHETARHGESAAGFRALRDALVEGARRKTGVLLDLLAREDLALLVACYGETHSAGHQFWQFHDPSHPLHDPEAPRDLQQALLRVHQEIDRGLARILEAAGPDCRVLLFSSHGMQVRTLNSHLMQAFAVRLGLHREASARLWWRVPTRLKRSLRRLVPRSWQHGFYHSSLRMGPGSRAMALPYGPSGAFRLNRVGREPHGCVAPGAEADALLDEIRRELLALRQVGSGEPIVKQVYTAVEAFGADPHPDVPDLAVSFRDDLGTLDACESERVGRIQSPVYGSGSQPIYGQHGPPGRLWLRAPGYPAGSRRGPADVLDLAPTVLDLLGVPIPSAMDGRRLAEHLRDLGS